MTDSGKSGTLQSPRGERIASICDECGLEYLRLQSPRGERIASGEIEQIQSKNNRCSPREGSGLHRFYVAPRMGSVD